MYESKWKCLLSMLSWLGRTVLSSIPKETLRFKIFYVLNIILNINIISNLNSIAVIKN